MNVPAEESPRKMLPTNEGGITNYTRRHSIVDGRVNQNKSSEADWIDKDPRRSAGQGRFVLGHLVEVQTAGRDVGGALYIYFVIEMPHLSPE